MVPATKRKCPWWVPNNLRKFRALAADFSDDELRTEIRYYAGWVARIDAGEPTVLRRAEMLARLRACNHEARKVRGWEGLKP
jgi:hypothetical protein